jgi:hypothetical protein
MAGFDLRASFISLLATERLARAVPQRLNQDSPVVHFLSPPRVNFPSEFRVPGVAYTDGEAPLPLQLTRELSLSDRLLPTPGNVKANLTEERTEYVVRKLFDVEAIARAETFVSLPGADNTTNRFVTASYTDASEYWLSIQGSLTGPEGNTYSFILECDGAALAGAYSEIAFESEMVDGCLLRLQPLASQSPHIEEAEFDSIRWLGVVADPEAVSVFVAGEARVDGRRTPIHMKVRLGRDVVIVEVNGVKDSQPLLTGSAPRERVNARLAGGLNPPRDGKIVLLDRGSGQEVRRVPVSGRLAGSAWDGEHLWQVLWPEGRVVKIDLRDGGGIVEELSLPGEGRVNGLTFSGDEAILGACSANIMRQTGDTSLQFFHPDDGSLFKRLPRPHVASSGLTAHPRGIFAVVSGIDQTPVSSDSAILVLDEETGEIKEAILFPRNFFIEDIDRENDDSILLAVTEGLPGMALASAIYQLLLR